MACSSRLQHEIWELGWTFGFSPSHRMYLCKFQQLKLTQATAEFSLQVCAHTHNYSCNSFFISNSCERTEAITSLLTFNQDLSSRDLRAQFHRPRAGQRSSFAAHIQPESSRLVSRAFNQHSSTSTWRQPLLPPPPVYVSHQPQALLIPAPSDVPIISIDQSCLGKRTADQPGTCF